MDLFRERLVTTLNEDVPTEVKETAVFTILQYCSYSKQGLTCMIYGKAMKGKNERWVQEVRQGKIYFSF